MSDIQLAKVNEEINVQLADKHVANMLLETTFKGLTQVNMKKAILEGHIRGFTFKDFLQKDVYAVPFGGGYALVESIGRARKIGARSGVNGKSAPRFTMDGKKIVDCTITVYKKGGHPEGYTATVDFDEYKAEKSIWRSKPKTMIAKVAEMHALRMACPEEMSQTYIEEEFDQPERTSIITQEMKDSAPTMGKLLANNEDHEEENEDGEAQSSLGFDVASGMAEGAGYLDPKDRRVSRKKV